MGFRENLQYLRSKRDMTQSDLAGLVGVSRQSVTKWESEKSYPEMDKLIMICDLLDCTLDELVRDDLTSKTTKKLSLVSLSPSTVDVCGYNEHMQRFAWDMAAGLASFFMGCALASLVCGQWAPMIFIFCVVIALYFTGFAVRRHRAFRRAHPYIKDFYTADERARARKNKNWGIVVSFALAAVGVSIPSLLLHSATFNVAGFSVFSCMAGALALGVYGIIRDHNSHAAHNRRIEPSGGHLSSVQPVHTLPLCHAGPGEPRQILC